MGSLKTIKSLKLLYGFCLVFISVNYFVVGKCLEKENKDCRMDIRRNIFKERVEVTSITKMNARKK